MKETSLPWQNRNDCKVQPLVQTHFCEISVQPSLPLCYLDKVQVTLSDTQ